MATESTSYITDLDPVLELQPTDNFVIETVDGTRRILFKDFILGQDNVDFYEEIAQNSLDILSLSADYSTLNSSFSTLSSSLTTQQDELSASVDYSLRYGYCYVSFDSSGTMTIQSSSLNIYSIESIEAGSKVLITAEEDYDINFANAAVNITLDTALSASGVTTAFQIFNPYIDSRSDNELTVGISNSIFGGFTTTLSAKDLTSTLPIKSNGINITFRYV